MTGRLSVLQVAAPADYGGLERVVQSLSRGLLERGHDLHVVGVVEPDRADSPFFGPLEEAGVPFTRVVVPARGYFRERRRIRAICRQLRPDVVHTHGYRPDVVDAPVARRMKIATVTTFHGSTLAGGGGGKLSWAEKLQRRTAPSFDAVISVSAPLADELIAAGVSRDRLYVVRNGFLSTSEPLGRDAAREALGLAGAERPVVGMVGRLEGVKGPDVLLEAMAELPLATLSLVGDGPERAVLKRSVGRLGLEDRVRFHGVVRDAGRLLAAFDVLALPSRSEGTPIVLLEALAAGTPVVATRVGGIPDVVDEGSAWLVAPEDPGALAEALAEALTDPEMARKRRSAGQRVLADRFSAERWLSQHEKLYRRIAGPR